MSFGPPRTSRYERRRLRRGLWAVRCPPWWSTGTSVGSLVSLVRFWGAWLALPNPSRWLLRTIRLGYAIQFAWRPPKYRGIHSTTVRAAGTLYVLSVLFGVVCLLASMSKSQFKAKQLEGESEAHYRRCVPPCKHYMSAGDTHSLCGVCLGARHAESEDVFLLAISSLKRVGDLQALSVAPTHLDFAPGMAKVF